VLEACVKINPARPVPVVSILEGGYDLPALASSALVHVKVLAKGYPAPQPPDADADDDGPSKHGGDEASALAEYIKGLNL
jgi:acetoin utilization deacetylase AcuC-like enzyme